jgi:hypothetical protein
MNVYKGPLDIPTIIGRLIAEVVEDFARDREFEYHLWHQDEPLWFVRRESEEEHFFQAVQIAAFLIDDIEQLCFIPQAYRFEGKSLRKTSPAATKTVKRPLKDFSSTNQGAIRKKLQGLLEEAWKQAASFRVADLTEQSHS